MSDTMAMNERTVKKDGRKKRMSIRKILAVVFCAGALICGVGVGISLVEYSSFEFLGEKNIGGNDVESKTITEDLYRGTDGSGKVYIHSYYGEDQQMTLETSKDVPKDQIQFVVEYNPNNVKDIIVDKEELMGNDPYYDEYYGYSEYYYGDVQVGQQTKPQSYVTYMVNPVLSQDSGLEMFFTYKDEILQNIKEKRFYEYEYPSITSVKVRIHPSNKDVVSLY